jgi:hypothetical protein
MIGTLGGRWRAGRRGHGHDGGKAGVPPHAGRGREGSVVRELRELARSPSMELVGRERRRRGVLTVGDRASGGGAAPVAGKTRIRARGSLTGG